MDGRVKSHTLCWSCYKSTNGDWCPFVKDVNNSVDGWEVEKAMVCVDPKLKKFEETVRVYKCPLYLYDYNFEGIEQFLKSQELPPQEIKKRMDSVHYRFATYDDRHKPQAQEVNEYLQVKVYKNYREYKKSRNTLSEDYINGN